MSEISYSEINKNSIIEDNIDFKKMFLELYYYRWKIIIVSIVTFIIALIYTFTLQPLYKTTSLIQVNTQNESNVLSSLGLKLNKTSATETELVLLKTRYILEPVIKSYGLNLIILPNYFPIFGQWISRHYHGQGVAKPFLGFSKYGWGGENLTIQCLQVPSEWEGNSFRLVVTNKNSFELLSTRDEVIVRGKVGERLTSNLYPDFLLQVNKLEGNPGMEFTVSYQSPTALVNNLSHNLLVKRVGGDSNFGSLEDTGIIQLQLTGTDPTQIQHILNSIVDYAISKNIQQKSREAQKTLLFLNQRLPDLRKSLELAENNLNQYHSSTGVINMAQASQLISQEWIELGRNLDKLNAQRHELLEIYTEHYPSVLATEQQIKELENKRQEVMRKIKKIPNATQKELNLIREVKIKTKMYEALLNNVHQLELIKGGLAGDIVALDSATPSSRLSSNKVIILLGGFLFGLFLSSIFIIIRSTLVRTVEDFNQLENEFRIPVRSVIPFSRNQEKLNKMIHSGLVSKDKSSLLPLVLAANSPKEVSIESLRSLRINLQLMYPASQHVTALMGSISGIGKSFIALNFAQILAETGKKVLLIDADLRKGVLHKSLLHSKSPGLSEFLEEKIDYEQLICPIHQNLFLIPCGNYTQHPLELFQKDSFLRLIQKAKNEFDEIVIDCPPILPVADSLLISKQCNIKLFVVASSDTFSNIKESIKKAYSHGVEISGFVFNYRRPLFKYVSSTSAYTQYAYGE